MTPESRFILFVGCIFAAVACGYAIRKFGLAKPSWPQRIMSAAIIGCDAPIACLAIWFFQMETGVWKVPIVGAIAGVLTVLVGLAIARGRRMAPADGAVFGLQAGMGNVGYTLGGAICFMIWDVQGLAVEQVFCMMWPFFGFLFCYPIARYYSESAALPPGEKAAGVRYAARLLWRSLTDLRSLPIYTAAAGLALNLEHVPPPEAVPRWHVLDIIMVAGIFMQFGGVGMTLKARRLPIFWKTAVGTAAIKFLVSPLLMLGAALALGLTGTPLYVCLLLSVMPSALYSVLMANLFGLNKDQANATFILTHAICFAVLIPVLAVWYLSG